MNSMFYSRLAITNIKKNGKTYLPYILSCIGAIVMYYIMVALSKDQGLDKIFGGGNLRPILALGRDVIAIFSAIFLFYTSSFLMKRRKKEFGLFNILGMEKRHISKIIFLETLFVAIFSLFTGILSGIVLSKLMYLILLQITHVNVQFGVNISYFAVAATLILFSVIFLLSLVSTLGQIHLSNPIDLLRGGEVGEKEPKSKWILTTIGIISLGSGYYIAQTVESPLDALVTFFASVILVIIGTYALFISGSIVFLKLLRKNKGYYYKTKHFTAISGMIYRMKQNAIGLANICILSTIVLVMLSTTLSLYMGMEDVLRTRYPRNIMLSDSEISSLQAQTIDKIVKEESYKLNIVPKDIIRYRYKGFPMNLNGSTFNKIDNDIAGIYQISDLALITLDEYNLMMNESKTLEADEVLIYSKSTGLSEETVSFGAHHFKIKERLEDLNVLTNSKNWSDYSGKYYIIVPNSETVEKIYSVGGNAQGSSEYLSYICAFDIDSENQIALDEAISDRLKNENINMYTECAQGSRQDFYSLYGGLLFIGIFLGALFIMATVLIIYYKQVSEGYDDKERFEIMQKVGMSHDEVKKSISSQVLTVFFLPLISAAIHIGFAFKVISKLLAALNLTNVTLFAWTTLGTILVFALFYAIVYGLTARVYYKIVG